ncbi:glycoside hydrolase family 32 protein [Lacrimispora sp.]|jgi:fructan beta-fructosidase|uniref:glycoside hydrolase family 32 protein n=1 Tax=Lacrimispora sp. TaxID=2719234 RepID=UPI00289A72C4|nr:glycoside hydrolase family 32 protein [Lacrimispora sp.]
MSSKGIRDFRPRIHFTPQDHWMNDPNGMVYINGTYHFCYQKYPYDTVWGPMHWGHAVTKDLLHWEHLPMALYPDELGYIFSGSSVYDKYNTSGYGTKENSPIISVFTSHNNETGLEQQSIAYSVDGGRHFEKSYLNPVIENPGIPDFRDPKVFWNPVHRCWGLVLAAQDRVYFYGSRDLKRWEKTGEFGPEGNHANGVWECPDLFQIKYEDKVFWILVVSMTKTDEGRWRTQYFIGDFDGDKFICTYPSDEAIWLDDGFDNYAGVTFQNYDVPLLMGWAMNWAYASKVPTNEYCGQATLARSLSICNTKAGYRIAGHAEGLDKFRHMAYPVSSGAHLMTETFGLRIIGEGNGKIRLSNSDGQRLEIEVAEDIITVNRAIAGYREFDEQFMTPECSIVSSKRLKEGNWDLEVIFDVSVLEVFADGGLNMVTMVVFPDTPYDTIRWKGKLEVSLFEIS